MLAILSPAKSVDTSPVHTKLPTTEPFFSAEAAALLELLRPLSEEQIAQLMKVSPRIAALNRERFQTMQLPRIAPDGLPAALLFAGDVYRGLDARSMSDDELTWAQGHIRILSGLFGLLRPLDRIEPYRLEMGTRLANPRGPDLYAWWGDQLAKRLDEELENHADRAVVDLASKEYGRAVPRKALRADRIEVQFKEIRGDKPTIIAVYAKRARGLFARWMVENRVERRYDLVHFDRDGYRFAEALSSASSLVFTRSS